MAQRKRAKSGAGKAQPDPATAVFINCPYDADFLPLFDAIVFTTVCCNFLPRSALESGSVAEPRMERITQAIFTSKYSIHDLSRCRGEGDEQLARFNMPLELGIAMARRYGQRRGHLRHDWLLLVPEGHQYGRFISDLAGFDPYRYDGRVETLIPRVMAWLATRPDAVTTPNPRQVIAALPAFSADATALRGEWGDTIPWPHLLRAARVRAPE